MVMFGSCLICFYHRLLDMIWSCLFRVMIFISGMVGYVQSVLVSLFCCLRVGVILIVELGLQSSLSEGNPITRAMNFRGFWVGNNSISRVGLQSSQSRGNPSSGVAVFETTSGGQSLQRSRFTVISEWGKSHQRSDELGRTLNWGQSRQQSGLIVMFERGKSHQRNDGL